MNMAKEIENININGEVYEIRKIYSKMGLTFERFVELLERDFYCPVLAFDPTSSVVSYTDTDGTIHDFRTGQFALVADPSAEGGFKVWQCLSNDGSESTWRLHDNAILVANDAKSLSEEANAYAKAAYTNSNEAVQTANAAKNAVETLEGLANTDEAQQILAAQVTQIAQNTSDVALLKEKHQVMSEEEYESLELVDQEKIYMLYED